MDITITISDTVGQVVREKAKENGTDVEHFVEEFVEKSFNNSSGECPERRHNLLAFAGKFSSGKTGTSERMHELFYEEDFNPAEGFSTR